MGIELDLLPVEGGCGCRDCGVWGYSQTVLRCAPSSELFDEIRKVQKRKGTAVPESFFTYVSRDDKYEDSHYGETQEDCYGDQIESLDVRELLKFKEQAQACPQNRAVWAYLAELPPRTKVALFWH